MATADWEFIYDGVIGFLTSPMWQIPIMSFIEQNCIVFDPSEENCHSWVDNHKDYKTLVENLLSSYLTDVGITEEQFVQACSAQSVQGRPQMQVVFEQIWAAEDFEIFKRMMVQRNIELELQALQLIQQKQGSKQNQKQSEDVRVPKKPEELATNEDEILKEVLRRSKLEYDVLQQEVNIVEDNKDKDIAKSFAESHENDVKILVEKAEEKKVEMKQAVVERIQAADSATKTEPKKDTIKPAKEEASSLTSKPPVEKSEMKKPKELAPVKPVSSAEAAATWLSNAKAEATGNVTGNSASKLAQSEAEDLAERERYLQKQRDTLLALKNKEREKRLDTYAETQPKRPTSARVARQAIRGNQTAQSTKETVEESDNLRMRKALAERLKKEVLYK